MTNAEKFRDYLRMLRRPFKKICRLRFLNPDGSTAFALDNSREQRNRAFIDSGNINVNLQNGARRSASVTLSNINQEYDYAANKLWFGTEIAVDEGLVLTNSEEFYIQQGIFLPEDPQEVLQPSNRTMVYNLVDKWANLDGTLGGVLPFTSIVPYGSSIFSAVSSALLTDMGDDRPLDKQAPIFTEFYNSKTQTLPDGTVFSLTDTPYELSVERGGTVADLFLGLAGMLNAWIGYDANGALRIDPSQDDLLDSAKEVMWDFSMNEAQFLNATYKVANTAVYNDYIVLGEQLDDYSQPCGRAQNLDPQSETNIQRIGLKSVVYDAAGYATDQQCQDLAAWKLKRSAVLQKSVTIAASQMFHIRENGLITLVRSDKEGSPVERHLVTGFSRPLASNGAMTLNCTSVNDFPIATITSWP